MGEHEYVESTAHGDGCSATNTKLATCECIDCTVLVRYKINIVDEGSDACYIKILLLLLKSCSYLTCLLKTINLQATDTADIDPASCKNVIC